MYTNTYNAILKADRCCATTLWQVFKDRRLLGYVTKEVALTCLNTETGGRGGAWPVDDPFIFSTVLIPSSKKVLPPKC